MLVIHLGLGMAGSSAGENCIIRRIGMTIGTLIPLSLVFPGIDGEILPVMIPGRWSPCSLVMTLIAGGRELGSLVAGIVRLVIVCNMAAGTGIRSIIVIPVVATGTGKRNMGACKNIIIIVNWEGGRGPVGICRVTIGAGFRDIDRNVIWID